MEYDGTAIGMRLQTFFGSQIQTIARQTRFVRRLSDLTGDVFLRAMVFTCIEHSKATLNQFAQTCLDLNVNISPQGFNERFGRESVLFMKEMFRQAMKIFHNQTCLPLPILQQFQNLHILDSSSLSLPPTMADEYPGCGGDGPQACLKIQLVFEFLRGNLEQVVFQPGRTPDQSFRDYLSSILPGSLILMDLGYFTLDHLKSIAQQAYFLTRYLYPTGLLNPDGERIELSHLLKTHPANLLDLPVLLGTRKKHHISCRLVAQRLCPEVADRRRQKAKEHARRDGRQATKAYLALLDWDFFLTNVPDTMLSTTQVMLLYRVRWQIELVFKLYKSYCGLRHIACLRPERILTELYARLIGIVLTHFLMAPIRMPYGGHHNREISPVQVRKIFQRFARSMHLVLSDLNELVCTLNDMMDHILRFGFKQKRKKRPNVCHALDLIATVHQLNITVDYESYLPALLS